MWSYKKRLYVKWRDYMWSYKKRLYVKLYEEIICEVIRRGLYVKL